MFILDYVAKIADNFLKVFLFLDLPIHKLLLLYLSETVITVDLFLADKASHINYL